MVTAGFRKRSGAGGPASGAVDPVIAASWTRCQDLVPRKTPGATLDPDPEDARRAGLASPLLADGLDLRRQLSELARETGMVAAVTDEKCRVLWTDGPRGVQRRADGIGLAPGGHWDELSVGTNAIGIVGETGTAAEVIGDDHWSTALRGWAAYATPITTATGALVGVVALMGRVSKATPVARHALLLLGQLASEHLPGVETPAAPTHEAGLALTVLGEPQVSRDGVPLALSPRQVELLTVLAIEGPATLDQLTERVYGDHPVSASTVKAELSHLRHLLDGAIGSRPYRILDAVRVDALDLRAMVSRGDLDGALELYCGQLLLKSEAPFAHDYRHVTDVVLRSALIAHGTAEQLLRFADVHRYDEGVLEKALTLAPPNSPLAAEIAARLEIAR